MDKILKNNIKNVQKLNDKASKGSIKNLYSRIEIGKLCLEGYTYWKANKKELKVTRDELVKAYGYGKTYFGMLRKAATVEVEDVERYIEHDKENNEYSIGGLLKFLKPETDKAKTWYTFSTAKEVGGGSVRLDENLDISMSGDKDEIIENLKYLLYELQRTEETEKANIELKEVVEA